MESLESILNRSKINVRKFERFKVDNIDHVRKSFIEAFKLVDNTFDEYQHLPEYEEVIEWINDTKGKGLFMTGYFGRGKSTILTGVLPLLFEMYYRKVLRPIQSTELHKTDLKWAVLIDDIGRETIVNDYGTKIDAVEFAISHCEDNSKLLIMTGNLNREVLNERYGGRILDRINRLCKVVVFKGDSLRR